MSHVSNPADIRQLEENVESIQAVTDALEVLTETGGTLTTDGTEQVVYVNETPAGVFRPLIVKIDFTAHEATETAVVRTYYRIVDGGAYVQQDEAEYIGVLDPLLLNIALEPNRYGVRVTIEKTAGTNRAYPWEAVYAV